MEKVLDQTIRKLIKIVIVYILTENNEKFYFVKTQTQFINKKHLSTSKGFFFTVPRYFKIDYFVIQMN